MSKIKYERDLGIFPTTLVDKSLTQNLVSSASPLRKYARNKFAFDQAALSPFVQIKNQNSERIH